MQNHFNKNLDLIFLSENFFKENLDENNSTEKIKNSSKFALHFQKCFFVIQIEILQLSVFGIICIMIGENSENNCMEIEEKERRNLKII